MAEAIVASTGKEEANEDLLKSALEELPKHMLMFSASLRKVYAMTESTQNEHTREISRMRHKVQNDAQVYTKYILPVCEETMRLISSYMENFIEFDLDDWKEGSEDALDEINKLRLCCILLNKMHVKIVTNLKRQENESDLATRQMQIKQENYERTAKKLDTASSFSTYFGYGTLVFGAVALAIPTGGASMVAGAGLVTGTALGGVALGTAIGAHIKRDNAKTTSEMHSIVTDILLPALKSFIGGLEYCNEYAVATRENLLKMHRHGTKAEAAEKEKKIKQYFKAMRRKARVISAVSELCESFIIKADRIRTDVASIPEEPGDKEYGNRWLEELKQDLKAEGDIEKFAQALPQLKN